MPIRGAQRLCVVQGHARLVPSDLGVVEHQCRGRLDCRGSALAVNDFNVVRAGPAEPDAPEDAVRLGALNCATICFGSGLGSSRAQ